MLTPAFNHLLCFRLMCSEEKVSELINYPVMGLFGTRVSGTRAKVIAQCVHLKLPTTTNRKRLLRNHWDLNAHRRGEKCLSETSRPGLISTVSPDLPQPTHRLEEEDTLRSILFLRLKASHLRLKDRLFNGTHYALL